MIPRARLASFLSRNLRRSTGSSHAPFRQRRMFLEQLETRLVMDAGGFHEDPATGFTGNFYPNRYSQVGTVGYLSAPQSGSALAVGMGYLQQHSDSLGITSADLSRAIITDQYTDTDDGTTHIYLQQTYGGLPITDALAAVHVTKYGQVIAANANFVPNLVHGAPEPIAPSNSPLEAISALSGIAGFPYPGSLGVLSDVGGINHRIIFEGGEISLDPLNVRLEYVPTATGLELGWSMEVRTPDGQHWYEVTIGARFDQRMNQLIRALDRRFDASYNVFPRPVQDPLYGSRAVVVDPQDAVASPFGWHDTDGVAGAEFLDTRGNNITAQEDLNSDNLGGTRPAGGATLDFNFTLTLPAAPATYQNAAITNAFYWTNLVHDVTYHYGYDEVSGNSQVLNYSGAGVGNDPVILDTQDPIALIPTGFGPFMLPAPEGSSARLTFGLSNGLTGTLTPARDTALDGSILVHEYMHNITTRLTGGSAAVNELNALQSSAMGEGWSDWLPLNFIVDATDNQNTPQTLGNWVLGQPASGVGVRRFPYSYDMSINPLTLDDFNGGFPNNESHNAGEIWASVLWDMEWLLINKYGFDNNLHTGTGGNNIAMEIVFDALKLQPANPTFIEARDAIIAADINANGGANYDLIWQAFARRGFGVNADAGIDSDSPVVLADFTTPPKSGRVFGTVYEDVNGNGQRQFGEGALAGYVVYIDANNNAAFDATERSATSAADGSYSLIVTSNFGDKVIRQVPVAEWKLTQPKSGSYSVNVESGGTYSGRNFGNQQFPGEIHGVKFNDLNGNGVQDIGVAGTPDEPGLAGVVVYVDTNLDGKIGVLEPAAVTDTNGNFAIKFVRPGTYTVREVAAPGWVQTFPSPTTAGGAHSGVVVDRNKITTLVGGFGNQAAIDYGDAPDSYHTLKANEGASAGVLPGFGLAYNPASPSVVVDGEADAALPLDGTSDDLTGIDDENGILDPTVLRNLTPGATVTIDLGVRTAGFPTGYLQGWVDFNRNGTFDDAGEQIFVDRQLNNGNHALTFTVPAGVSLGQSYARFRYDIDKGIKSSGHSLAGEVEDYVVNVLSTIPVANPDTLPLLGQPPIKLGTTNNVIQFIDLLQNDVGTNLNPPSSLSPTIVLSDFPRSTASGGTVRLNLVNEPTAGTPANTLLLYTPGPLASSTVADTFTYRIQDGTTPFNPSTFATVSINLTPADPVAIDDIDWTTLNTAKVIDVLANDTKPTGTTIVSVTPVGSAPAGALVINSGSLNVTFTPPTSQTGTFQYQYVIGAPGVSNSAPATITIQVSATPQSPFAGAAGQISLEYYRDVGGVPVRIADQSNPHISATDGFFYVLVSSRDLNTLGTIVGPPGVVPPTMGVVQTFVDLLVLQTGSVATPDIVNVLVPANPPFIPAPFTKSAFVIAFDNSYNLAPLDDAQFSSPGILNEIGATFGTAGAPVQPPLPGNNVDVPVMMVKFRILGAGTVTIQPDHADAAGTGIAVANPNADITNPVVLNPYPVTDLQVFLPKASTLTIDANSLVGGEGEFYTNALNKFDVNIDSNVNAQDILAVVNDIIANGGPHATSQFAIALTGKLPTGLVDTNQDGLINALDLLGIVNYMIASGGPVVGSGEGEAGGEGEAADWPQSTAGSASAAAADAAVVLLTADDSDRSAISSIKAQDQLFQIQTFGSEPRLVVDPPPVIHAAGGSRSHARRQRFIQSDAADELFGGLGEQAERPARVRHLSRRR